MTTPHVLAGVTVPLVTPLDDAGVPSPELAERLLVELAAAGVHSLMLLGSNGEGALLPADLTERFVQETTKRWRELRVGGRVIVNVSAPGTTDMLRRAESAMHAAPDALVVSPPSYFRHRPDEITAHLLAVERFAVAFAVYNVPKYANPVPPEAFIRLRESPLFVGMKDSSGDASAFSAFLAACADDPLVQVSQGDELALDTALAAGAAGIVPGLANLAPRLCVALYDAARSGDGETAAAHQSTLRAMAGLHAIRPGVPSVKALLDIRGVLAGRAVAGPLAAVTGDEASRLREFVAPFDEWLVGQDA